MDINSLILQLDGDDLALQIAAAQTLATLGEQAQPAALALVRAVGLPDEEVSEYCVAALESLGPPAGDQIQPLASLASDCSSDVAYWAITLLGRAGQGAAPAVATLANVLHGDADLSVRERAAWALGEIGPAAKSAAEALREAAQSPEPRLARLAEKALEAIGG